ncbi:GFP-like non-fluorescent chromoprotein [Montipora foliosa]|uniref:GFP-like non-fluorescent chromoprotein n=1 Tax=Montipora foliosa TaxID=591990 RepID=UPI0035F216BB
MNTKQKIQDGLQQVSKEHFYKPLTRPKVITIINALFANGHIDQMTHKWLSLVQNQPQIPEFYTLTKIHKAILVSRPIVYGSGGPTSQNALLVLWIRFYNRSHKNKAYYYIRDTTHFINFSIENTPLSEAAILATLDVCSLCTNIPHEEGIEIVCRFYEEHYQGEQTVKLTVTKGGPLPFAWDILSPLSQYGSIPFTKYPEDIPDYVKQSFPEGYTWERIMNFEDGAVCTVSNDSSIQGNCFIYNVKISGLNFPPNGPVMQKKTQGWEPNTERLFARDGMLIGNNFMALKLEGGGHYLCEFKSTYKAKKPVKMPGYHYVDRKLDVTSHNKDYTSVEQCEISIARHSLLG